jgi:hypothetical protein
MLGGLLGVLGGLLCIELEALELEELGLEELELGELIDVLLGLEMPVVCCATRIVEQEERMATANQDSRIGASR